jgi:uncharacterized protein YprB with RNaseH-like and TPR domain
MLTASFCCFRGITAAAEARLWQAGVLSWADFLRDGGRVVSARKADGVKRQIEEAAKALEAGLLGYFLARLPPAHRVRVLAHAAGRAAYLDIETTGLGRGAAVTTVALANRERVRVFVEGEDLPDLLPEIAGSTLLVTYNGARFDVPFLVRRFGMPLPMPHLDLLPVLRMLGLRGGLKACERQTGSRRADDGVGGADAVRWWRQWRERGDRLALQRLVLYNARDACSLQRLARHALRLSLSAYPLGLSSLPFGL